MEGTHAHVCVCVSAVVFEHKTPKETWAVGVKGLKSLLKRESESFNDRSPSDDTAQLCVDRFDLDASRLSVIENDK